MNPNFVSGRRAILGRIRVYQHPGKISESIVCDGCIISGGTVWGSIVSPGVVVERDAHVEQSVIFDDVVIEPGAA
jgi:ADP-glucose pyrophosphorylase